jgi:phage-related protein
MAAGAGGWEVELFDLGDGETALDELAKELTKKQLAQAAKQLGRLKQYGRGLGAGYFGKLEGSTKKLWEFRLSVADRCEIRFIFVQVERTFYMLKGFKHQSDDDVRRRIPTAERRLGEWGIKP